MKIKFDSSAAWKYAGKLAAAATTVGPKADRATRTYGDMMLARARASAQGRPGPRRITGKFVGSIKVAYRMSAAQGVFVAELTSDRPQAARLEFGFVGYDSLGRYYRQPPYPWAKPAIEQTERFARGSLGRLGTQWVPAV